MKYFKDKNTNEVYAYDQEQIDGGWVKEGLVPMTDEEVSAHLNPKPTPEQILASQLAEAQTYLDRTDHKFYIGYVPKAGEDCAAIQALRDEKREFIRANE